MPTASYGCSCRGWLVSVDIEYKAMVWGESNATQSTVHIENWHQNCSSICTCSKGIVPSLVPKTTPIFFDYHHAVSRVMYGTFPKHALVAQYYSCVPCHTMHGSNAQLLFLARRWSKCKPFMNVQDQSHWTKLYCDEVILCTIRVWDL